MKHLTDYISTSILMLEDFKQTMAEIELDMVFESFKCSILKEIREQISALRAKEDKSIAPDNFSKMFQYKTIRWDTITDDQVKEYTKDSKDGLKLAKRICSNRSNSVPGIIVNATKDPDDVVKYSSLIQKSNWDIRFYNLVGKNYADGTMKPGDIEQALSDKFWIIELRNDQINNESQSQRRDAKSGTIKMGDPNQYADIAKSYLEKYKRLAEKKPVKKDTITDKVMEYMDKIISIAETFSKDPVKHSAYEYSIGTMLNLVGDRCHYDPKHTAIGQDGLMILYNKYLSYKMKLAGAEHEASDKKGALEAAKRIKELFSKIDKKIADIKLD